MADGAFELGPDVQIVLDAKGTLVLANERARTMLRLGPRARAPHFRELDLPADVLGLVEQTFGNASATRLTDMRLAEVVWTSATGDPAFYKVTLRPIREPSGAVDGVSIVLQDITDQRKLQEQLERSRHELETVSEELQSSNEELETTNEELQSTVEELETTNEELQSTNEELETMNEELQSTNEELHTMNSELRERSDDLNSVNGFLGSVLSGIRDGLIVVNRGGQITAWNPAAEELWGLRAAEVQGKPFFGLDIGLPVDQLGAAVRRGLNGESGLVTVHAVNRRGKNVSCSVVVTPLKSSTGEIQGAVLLMQAKDA
jgi:two-component system CheB/CheR fusion protein